MIMQEEHQLDEFLPGETVTGRGRKLLAGLIDAAIAFGTVYSSLIVFQLDLAIKFANAVTMPMLVLIVFIIYRLFFMVLVNGTPGMHIFQIRLLDGNEKPASLVEKIFAAVFVLLNGADYYDKKQS